MTLDNLQLETPRLLLRLPRAEDLDPFAEMMADQEAARFIGGVMPRSVSWRGLMTMIGAWHANGFAMFSVVEKSSGRWIGRLGPWMPEGWPGTEVGWAIVRDCWGQGYAQVVARKLGSRNLGPGSLPAPYQESRIDIWGQSRDEWRARRQ